MKGSRPTLRQPPADSLRPAPASVGDAIDLIGAKLGHWAAVAVAQLPNLLVAVLVAVGFWLVARAVRSALDRGLRHTPLAAPLRQLLLNVAGFAIVAGGLFVALGVLGLDRTVTSLLAGVGIVGLALGFAFQDIAANFMAGVILSVRRPFRIGHLVETNGFLGVVSDISLRSMHLRQLTGELVHIPNKEVLGNALVNYAAHGERRVDVAVGVSYGDDLEEVRRVTLAALEGLACRRPDRPVELFFEGFGESAIDLVARFWIPFERQPDYLGARSDAVMAIKRAYDAAGITIPFPIRTLDFATVGGTTLPDALRPVLAERHGARDGRAEGGAAG